MQQYYFDTLPLHPQPKRLESLTSYLTRLAEINGITSILALAAICSLDKSAKGNAVRLMKDYPPLSFGSIEEVAVCPRTKLLQTTFFHIGKKFERSTLPYPLSGFLSESVGESLRYCPQCLAEHPYYSLLWRFLCLKGCYSHGCRLLECCGNCGRTIPFVTTALQIGICPSCNGHLRQCKSEDLTEAERLETLKISQELEYLLTPQEWETEHKSIAVKLGREFALLRRKHGFAVAQIKRQTNVSKSSPFVAAIESGTTSEAAFHHYFTFSGILGVTLPDIFDRMLQRKEEDKELEAIEVVGSLPEEEVLKRIGEAVDILRTNGKKITQNAICEFIHVAEMSLQKYPRVKALMERLSEELYTNRKMQKQFREMELLGAVQRAVDQLNDLRATITYVAVGRIVGIHPNTFKCYPLVIAFLRQSLTALHRTEMSLQYEEELVLKVEEAIQLMISSGRHLTQSMVAKTLGMSLDTLKAHARVRSLLDQRIGRFKNIEQKTATAYLLEEELVAQVEHAIVQLTSSGQKVTYRAIGKVVGKKPSALLRYPRVKAILELKAGWYQDWIRSLPTEDELVKKVQSAAEHLESSGQKVTYRAIGKIVGSQPTILREYPGVVAFLEEASNRALQIRHERVLAQVRAVIQELEESGQSLTHKAIGAKIGIADNSLNQYPEVASLVRSLVKEKKEQERVRRFHLREEELFSQVSEAIQGLQDTRSKITVKAVAKLVGVNHATLYLYPKVKTLIEELITKPHKI